MNITQAELNTRPDYPAGSQALPSGPFRQFMDYLEDAVLIMKFDLRVVYANSAAEALLGYSRDELLNMSLNQFYVAEFSAQVVDTVKSTINGQVNTSAAPMLRKNGRPLAAQSRFWYGMWNNQRAIYCTLRDQTGQRRLEVELGMLSHAVRNISQGLSVLDLQGNIIFVNDPFLQTVGYSKEDLIGRNIKNLLQKDDLPDSANNLVSQNLTHGWSGELTARRSDDNDIAIHLKLKPVKDEQGKPVVVIAVMEDISEKKQLESQLQQSQKMEAIGQLAGGIAHDFNNLLTVIEGYTELLTEETRKAKKASGYVRQIKKASDRATSLTGQLLAFSRRQILQPRLLDINDLIDDMSGLLKRLIGEDVQLATKLAASTANIKADPGQIEQVIMNLVVNARDAMPEGGYLSIESEEVYLDDQYERSHSGVKSGHYVMLSISDSGKGMSKELQKRIFEPFFTTKKKGEGTGLGLATVYGIVKQSDGHIWVYSEPGHGTTFKIYFPAQMKKAKKRSRKQNDNKPMTGHQTILVVEDDFLVRELVCDTLRNNGYTVIEAANGKQALDLFSEYEEKIDLVLTDVIMPEMSGRKLVEQLNGLGSNVQAVYMSGYTDDAIIKHGVLEPGMEYIQKPFSPTALTRKLYKLFNSED